MNRSGANSLPDEPWPLSTRSLLSARERVFYQRLAELYPEHKIQVQVALSQLIRVDRRHPESESIRARYKQLVADFVLCRPDMSVVVVIELDDRSHERPHRQAADARKNKALADAGIRLVRIPAGRLPSAVVLNGLIDTSKALEAGVHQEAPLRLVEPVDTYEVVAEHPWYDDSGGEAAELRRLVLKAIGLVVLVLGGWVIFAQVLPGAVKLVFQPPVATQPRAVRITKKTLSEIPPQRPGLPLVAGATTEDLNEKRRALLAEATAVEGQKSLAWSAFYSVPASCEHPIDWNAQVECGNRYMRARKAFEQKWKAEQPSR